jgi:DNA-damage-inducible protein D
MEKLTIIKLTKNFEEYANRKDNVEFWFARDLQILLGYVEWRKFIGVIEKAKESCNNSGNNSNDHFVGAAQTISMPKSASKEI